MPETDTNHPAPPRRPSASWLIGISLAVIAACLLVEVTVGVLEARPAEPAATSAGAGHLFAVAGQVSSNSYGVYILDARNGTMALYEWLPGVRKLRLLASRNFTYDLQLDEYNTLPSPGEIKDLVEQSRRLPAAGGGPDRPAADTGE